MSKGCKQVPPDYTRGVIRWAHPDGYLLNAKGQKIALDYGPAKRKNKGGKKYPQDCNKKCYHIEVALAFYGPRPDEAEIGVTKKRSDYFCHHLNNDIFDTRPDNLLCWLTRAEHSEADRRQRLLRKAVDGGNLYGIPYERLRWLQDPRVTSREDFECELAKIREQGFHHYDLDRQMEEELSNPIQFHLHND